MLSLCAHTQGVCTHATARSAHSTRSLRAEVLAIQLGRAAMRRRVPLAVNEDVEVGVPVDVLPREQLACDM